MTPDLEKLKKSKALNAMLEDLEFEFVEDPEWDEPSDTSYLSAKEREDPDIASNVEAMAATNKLISWFGQGEMGYVGFWRGPKGMDLEQSPIVALDSEGQYSIVATNIADFVAISVDEDSFADATSALTKAGLGPAKSQDAIWKSLDAFKGVDPNDYRHKLYNEGRVRRGLKPVKD